MRRSGKGETRHEDLSGKREAASLQRVDAEREGEGEDVVTADCKTIVQAKWVGLRLLTTSEHAE